jgi:hypothetical protein
MVSFQRFRYPKRDIAARISKISRTGNLVSGFPSGAHLC